MRVVLALFLAALPVPAGAERPAPDRSPVRLLLHDHGRCSAVAMSPTVALTAGHCLNPPLRVDGREVSGTLIADDLARLAGHFAPPYARLAGRLTDDVLLEGYGCDAAPVWLGEQPRREVRPGLLVPASGPLGLELVIAGRVCPGDSGGAVWADRGNLLGIITATASEPQYARRLAFATPARL